MGDRFGCGECVKPHVVSGIFAFLYYAGRGKDIRHLDVVKQYYPPNALICRKHIEYIPEEILVLPRSDLIDMCELHLFGIMQVDGQYKGEALVLSTIWDPDIITMENARKQFPLAVQRLEPRIQGALEEKLNGVPPGYDRMN